MHSFKSYLTELFDNPRDIKWRPRLEYDSIYGKATVGVDFIGTFHTSAGKEYQIHFDCKVKHMRFSKKPHFHVKYAEVTFLYISPTRMGPYSLTGTGNEMEVFSTVIQGIEEFITQFHPDEITFTAAKGKKSLFGNKVKLYGIITNKFKPKLKELGYTVSTQDNPDFLEYQISKEGL